MKIAVSGETPAKQYNLDEIAGFISNYGADGIELWPENMEVLHGKVCTHRLYRNADVDSTIKILEKHGIQCACVAFGAAFDKQLAADEALYAQELFRAVEVADMLQSKLVNHYLYYLSMGDVADTDRLLRIFSPAISLAEKKGITLVLENEAHDSTKNPLEMKRIVNEINSPNFKTNFDAINYYQANCEGFPYAYTVLKDLIFYVHLKDGCEYVPEHNHTSDALGGEMSNEKKGRYIYYPPIGQGVLNIDGQLKALSNNGYDGWCTLEPHTTTKIWHQYVKNEIKYLKNTSIF